MWQTNSYVVYKEGSEKCWIIDAGFEPGSMIEFIRTEQLKPEYLIYTHTHLDHIAGTGEICGAFPDIKTAVCSREKGFAGDPVKNLSAMSGMNIAAKEADIFLGEGQLLDFEGSSFRVIETPGHSPGGICLYQEDENVLFSGDTLFQGSVGRYDFPGSNGEALFNSIKEKLLVLPDETKAFPGHGGATTIGEEKKHNPFL